MELSDLNKFSDTDEFEALDAPVLEWPVVVEVTSTYIVWTEAASHEEAIANAKDDGDLHYELTEENFRDSDWHVVENAFPWEYEEQIPREYGPRTRCPECLFVAYQIGYQPHAFGCRLDTRHG